MPRTSTIRADPFFIYGVNQTVHWFIVGLMFPVLILIILGKGLSILEAGTILAAYSGTTLLLELPTGGLADSIGRKRVYLLSLLVMFAAAFTLLLSSGFLLVLVAIMLYGVARALSSGTMDAWFVDEYKRKHPAGNLQRAMSKAMVFSPIGLGVGSLIGGFIPTVLGSSAPISGSSPYSMNIVIVLLAIVAQIVLTIFIVVEVVKSEADSGLAAGFRKVPEILSSSVAYGIKNRVTFALLVTTLFLGLGLASVELLWQPRVQAITGGVGETWVLGVLAAGYFLMASVGSIVSTPICRMTGDNYPRILIGMRVVLGGLLFALALQGSILAFALFYLLLYFMIGTAGSPHAALYNDQIPSKQRATMMSFESLIAQGGGLIGALLIGFVADIWSIPIAWMLAGVILAISSLAYLYLALNAKRLNLLACSGPGKVGSDDEIL